MAQEKDLSTEVTEEDIKNGIEDEFGVVYSKDGKRLLKCKNEELDHYTIKEGTKVICDKAFIYSNLQQISIVDSVTIIGVSVFRECYYLQQIIIPNSVTDIGECAFEGCKSLKQVTLSNALTSISNEMFYYCVALQSVIIPNSITIIGDKAFQFCKSLTEITVPNSIKCIGNLAFRYCDQLQQFIIPNSVTTIGKNPFAACRNITIISKSKHFIIDNNYLIDNHKIISYLGKNQNDEIPDTISRIDDFAFASSSPLQKIIIPNTVTSIGNNAFDASGILEITIPDSVTMIGEEAFADCNYLKKVILSKSITTIRASTFLNCHSLEDIFMPNSISSICQQAFWGCKKLQHISIPNSVIFIGDFAFRECKSLQIVNIPDSVSSIGRYVFNQCDSLQPFVASELVHRISEIELTSKSNNVQNEKIQIKKIKIKNFRAFKDEIEVCFNDFNCIIGKNDSGKSSIFAALEWFFDVHKELKETDLNSNDNYFTEKLTQYGNSGIISVEVYFCGDVSHFYFGKFVKDFLDKENCICIKKSISFDSTDKIKMDYSIKQYSFKKLNGKPLSDLNFDELKFEYQKIANQYDELWNTIQHYKDNSRIDKNELEIKLREKLYSYYLNTERKEQWPKLDSHRLFNNYKYYLFNSNNSLNHYLNKLLEIKYIDSVESVKSRMATDISLMLSGKDVSDKIRFKKNETLDLFNDDDLVLSTGNLPLKNRGEGFQFKVKKTIFELLSEMQAQNHNSIFAFEEPETHLHPTAQREMYQTIKKLSENPNYQLLMTTHSPYIVKELQQDNSNIIVVKRNDQENRSYISHLEERVLPYVSMNEINYIAFEYSSEEYHQELYGQIEIDWFGESNGSKIDQILNKLRDYKYSNREETFGKIVQQLIDKYNYAKKSNIDLLANEFISPDKGKEPSRCICHCVRNSIDHPCGGNAKWKRDGLIDLSIKILLEINNCFKDIRKIFSEKIKDKTKLVKLPDKLKDCVDEECKIKKDIHLREILNAVNLLKTSQHTK